MIKKKHKAWVVIVDGKGIANKLAVNAPFCPLSVWDSRKHAREHARKFIRDKATAIACVISYSIPKKKS